MTKLDSRFHDSCVDITGPSATTRGSGFFVDRNQLLTCWHVVDYAPAETEVRIRIPKTGIQKKGRIIGIVETADCALIEIEEVLHDINPLIVSPISLEQGESWESYGFPEATNRSGLPLSGTVIESDGTDPGDLSACVLFSNQITAGAHLKGLSGSPVLVNGQVRGMLRKIISDKTNSSGAQFGTVYACHPSALLQLAPLSKTAYTPCQWLVTKLNSSLSQTSIGRVRQEALNFIIPRPMAEHALKQQLRHKASAPVLVLAPAGHGKSTWSLHRAYQLAGMEPVIWTVATDLALHEVDPISLRIAHIVFGLPDVTRIEYLADQLRREHAILRVFLDGIEEVRDYSAIERALRVFQSSVLSPVTQLILTCREEAMSALRPAIACLFPQDLGTSRKAGHTYILLDELKKENARALLAREGLSDEKIISLLRSLPSRFCGNPLILLRVCRLSVPLPTDEAALIEAIVDDFIHDIVERLKIGGAAPSRARVLRFLSNLALAALTNVRDEADLDTALKLPDSDGTEGECSFLGRSLQSGLLVERIDSAIGFAHALFLEVLAARGIDADCSSTKLENLLRNPSRSSRGVILRLAPRLHKIETFISHLLASEPLLAAEIAGCTRIPLSTETQEKLIKACCELLQSRFPSDHKRALRLLSRIAGPSALKVVTDWFNPLSQPQKQNYLLEVADAFLQMQEPGACHLIIYHYELIWPYYSSELVAKLNSLSDQMRNALMHYAREVLTRSTDINTCEYCAAIKISAILNDDWLLVFLGKKVSSERLHEIEHRALIYVNTRKSIDIYTDSVDLYFQEYSQIEDDPQGTARDDLMSAMVINHSDVRLFAHDQLTALLRDALTSGSWEHVFFGLEWARFLGERQLVEEHAKALESRGSFYSSRGFMEAIIREAPFAEINKLYNRTDSMQLKRDIVRYLHHCPGIETEEFLIERLQESEYGFAAIQTLGFLRSFRAGRHIQRFLGHSNWRMREVATMALGRIGFPPSLDDLLTFLRQILTENSEATAPHLDPNSQRKDLEWVLIQSIAAIGGETAYQGLVNLFPRIKLREHVLRSLIWANTKQAINALHEILRTYSEYRNSIVTQIARYPLEGAPRQLHLQDPVLFGYVIESALLGDLRLGGSSAPLQAIAQFDLPQAEQFLEQVARGECVYNHAPRLDSEDTKSSIYIRDPAIDAEEILARRGQPEFLKKYVLRTLMRFRESRNVLSESDLYWFREIPPALIRNALRDIIASEPTDSQTTYEALYYLQSYALPEDDALFQRYEGIADISIADIAHCYLQAPRRR